MKTPIPLLCILLAGGMALEAAPEKPGLEMKTTPAKVPSRIESPSVGANRVISERYSVSGIAVQAVKTRRVFQLLNPVAPPRYFAGNANTVRDPKSGRVEGLKLVSLEF